MADQAHEPKLSPEGEAPTKTGLTEPPKGGTGLVLSDATKHHALASLFSIEPQNITELISMAKMYANSELVPKEFQKKPQNIIIAIQMGRSVGLSSMQSLLSIAVINGRPTIWGDAIPALLYYHRVLEPTFGNGGILERMPDEALTARMGECSIKRSGWSSPLTRRFSYAEAEAAGLIKRSQGGEGAKGVGPWITYPGRMLQMRARAWAARDACPDVLKGLAIREEVEDTVLLDAQTGEPVRRTIAPPKTIIDVQKLDEFNREVERAQPASAGSIAGPRAAAPPPSDATAWTGVLDKITEQPTQNPKVKKFFVIGKDGTKFQTIKHDLRDKAKEMISSGELAKVSYVTNQWGNEIQSIGAAEQPPEEGQEEPGSAG